ncbi:MAG: T9SS type A sorting domain-containing protein [candidate division KSB1 bacterium]|nr:T9SS type A sorting domain-containing protein [candidate division KSB1 bacterium]
MRGSRVLAALVAAVLALPAGLVAQDELIIPPTDGSTFLNKQIEDDVSRPPGRVYVLKRDGFYLFNGVLTNNGWVLRIRAEEGTGQKPVIYLIADAATGVFPSHFIEMGEDVYLKDIVLVGFIESMEGQIANNPPRLIRSRAAGFDLVIDGCIITQSRGEHIRLEQATRLVKITNCIFANMGDLGTSNLGAGKPIDFRNASCDSALFINNTFVNFHDRVVRHRASVAAINHFIFDHNTVVNSLGYHGTLVLGWLGKECRITNNLFVDHFIAGADTDRTRQAEFEEPGELDPRNGLGRMAWVLSVPNDTTHWVVTGNYYAVSPEVQAFYDRHAAEGLLGEGPALTHHICSRLGADSSNAFVKEDIVLANRPRPMVNMAEWYRNPNGGNKTKNTPSDKWNRATDDYDRRPWQYFADTLDCSYPTSTAAYTGALGGFPAGDLNWFPAKKAEWEVWVTSVERRQAAPLEFALYQNYPNPFNPCTTIRFNISRPEFVTLKIYDMLGRLVATPLAQRVGAGQHVITFDGSQLPSGVYLYAIQAGRHEAFRKMVLMK